MRLTDQVAAPEAYDEAARLWFGEHAYLNLPDGVAAWVESEAATAPDADADGGNADPHAPPAAA